MTIKRHKIEFGDFQTPLTLAHNVVQLVKQVYPRPDAVLEPTCGKGTFLLSAAQEWDSRIRYYGFDINSQYIEELNRKWKQENRITLEPADFFQKDWTSFFKSNHGSWLIIGNPPWVTNSSLGSLDSQNVPLKNNFQQLKGFEAKTGKANFDIAEWIIIRIVESLRESAACVAMLCKTATARKVLRYLWNNDSEIHNTSIHRINASKHFDVAVEACLFLTQVGEGKKDKDAVVYSDLTFTEKTGHIGIIHKELLANVDLYEKYKYLDGDKNYGWRSGLKHDASKVMELERLGDKFINGYKEVIELEERYIYPLLKSSDVANANLRSRKYVIVTQRQVKDPTEDIKQHAPRTWDYLKRYSNELDGRKSIIYKNRPPFSIFGIGDYSFSPWKVAVSGLYKNYQFVVVGNCGGKPVMVDDTCYFLSCQTESEAVGLCELLNSETCRNFIKSLIFPDAKRPISIDLLKRINIPILIEKFQPDGRFDADHFNFPMLQKKQDGLFSTCNL